MCLVNSWIVINQHVKALSGLHPKVGSRNCLNAESLSKLQGNLYYQHILACNWFGRDPNNTRKVAVNFSQEGGITVKKYFYEEGPRINLFNYFITLFSIRAKSIPIFSVDDRDNCYVNLYCSQTYCNTFIYCMYLPIPTIHWI